MILRVPDPMTIAGVVVGATVGGGLLLYYSRAAKKQKHVEEVDAKTERAGHVEPVSLHPKIDEHKCICTGACVQVCPEKDVLGMIDGKPKLIRPSACIGHGECMRACPVEAITLVIGSEKRGVDLPLLGKDFQTNVPGLYIAGELGGMGLIHNAVNQGRQAIDAITASLPKQRAGDALDVFDVFIVGAGPAGLSAALAAKRDGLTFALVDQEQLGGAVRSFPRQKVVMTAPVDLPIYGKIKLRRTTKEALLELWEEVVAKTGVSIEAPVKVSDIKREPDGTFTIESSVGQKRARRVLLAIGRRGTPRKLGVPGEELPKVTYKMIEPEQYRGTKVMVFGGGDAAVESALMLSREPGTRVTLVHRGDKFDRCKPDNADALEQARTDGSLDVRLSASATQIAGDHVVIKCGDATLRVENDFVVVSIGGELPTAWLGKIGIEVKTLRGEAHPAMS
jgi:thioredoxin reductase/NAD-dependent dihydropyrimidine dehydrogenase PreA subunit